MAIYVSEFESNFLPLSLSLLLSLFLPLSPSFFLSLSLFLPPSLSHFPLSHTHKLCRATLYMGSPCAHCVSFLLLFLFLFWFSSTHVPLLWKLFINISTKSLHAPTFGLWFVFFCSTSILTGVHLFLFVVVLLTLVTFYSDTTTSSLLPMQSCLSCCLCFSVMFAFIPLS